MHLLTHTAGDHCESCTFAYYRPSGVSPNDSTPCVPCDCDTQGVTDNGDCVKVHIVYSLGSQLLYTFKSISIF